MKIINKIKESRNSYKTTKIFIAGILVWSLERNFLRKDLKLFGIPLLSFKRKSSVYKNEQIFDDINKFVYFTKEKCLSTHKKALLWVDHSLKGGTETYSFNQFSELQKKYILIRLQYNPWFDVYVFSIPGKALGYTLNFDIVKAVISQFDFFEICVNSIVSWAKPLELLMSISCYKKNYPQTKVSFRGHDFYAICPSFNLLNCDNVFCNLSYKKGCSYCMKNVKSDHHKMLFSGFEDINIWRKSWNEFFQNTCDEMVVFSNSTKELFIRVYPILETKICIIPHKTIQLPIVQVENHKDINIAMLGNISSVAKGADVVRKMCESNKDSHLKLVVIGTYENAPQGLIVTGKYKPSDIPNLIKKHHIDIVFIPSVCPETFSYTTSEAMSMHIPVVCYNLGAPAERISKYEKGLVLKDIHPLKNLKEIKKFVEKLRKKTK